ncbi:MAG: hypothetical protein HYX84_04470 [Chloroflexi bacterium]|nr:hypothetical protein [Chloroflexota bacterium]
MTIAILYRPELREYDFGAGHPFQGNRFEAFHRFLRQTLPEDDNYRILQAAQASDDDLSLICARDYIDFTRGFYRAAALGQRFSQAQNVSRFLSRDNLPAGQPGKVEEGARFIIGQAKLACDLVQGGAFRKVVSIGGGLHHAKHDYGEGFCLYNDVAFCGMYLLKEYRLERILILDTDAHAGNGTMDYFYGDPRILFIDLHQDPATIYPGVGFAGEIGTGRGKGFTINIPMPVHAGDECYRLALESIVEPVTAEFNPQIIIRNGGSDPHFSDELTNLGLTLKGFSMIGKKVNKMAGICQGRVIDLIASGYNAEVLPRAWLALVTGLGGIKLDLNDLEPLPSHLQADRALPATQRVIAEVKIQLKDYWQCLR